jgi:hypothetical protein
MAREEDTRDMSRLIFSLLIPLVERHFHVAIFDFLLAHNIIIFDLVKEWSNPVATRIAGRITY